jgi:hypothetical protein
LPETRRSTDGEAHGDPPYLLESGWTPLLNGKDLAGWHAQNGKPLEWFTTRGVRWEQYGPTRLFAEPSGGGSMLNSAQGKTSNIVTDQKFGDLELYLEFMISRAATPACICRVSMKSRSSTATEPGGDWQRRLRRRLSALDR